MEASHIMLFHYIICGFISLAFSNFNALIKCAHSETQLKHACILEQKLNEKKKQQRMKKILRILLVCIQ